MQRFLSHSSFGVVLGAGSLLLACSSENKGSSDGTGAPANVGGSTSPSNAGSPSTGAVGSSLGGMGALMTGGGGSIAHLGAGGSVTGGGGTSVIGPPGAGGSSPGAGGSGPAAGGASPAAGGATGTAGAPPTNCMSTSSVGPTVFGMFPAGDPAKKGTFAVTTTNNTGPNSYTLYRPTDFSKGGPLFPVITWGNGTGTTPSTYSFLLTALASHGFIVIASNSMNVAQGTPPPMLDGVTWVFAQNCDPMSPMYQHVDTAHVGATGHSQGAFATMTAGADSRIVATAPIEGSLPGKLHGPSLLLCGSMDATVGCMGAQSAFNSITGVPLMYAELQPADHTNWISASITAQFRGGDPSPFVTAVVGWMRVFLMNDTSLKSMFVGADCTLCKDATNWKIQQKMLN